MQTSKHPLFSILLFLVIPVFGCAEPDLETQLIEQNAQEQQVLLPPEVLAAMEAGIDEVEVPINISEKGLAKPSEFSKIYFIDYVGHSDASVVEKARPPADTANCGTSSAYNVKKHKWKEFPITYSINTENLTAGVDLVAAKEALLNGFNALELERKIAENFFLEAKEGETPKLTVRWAPIDGAGRVLALAENSFNNKTKIIFSSRLIFDTGDTWKVFSSFDCKSQGSEFDIASIATHEIGHVLGFLHPPNTKKNASLTMYASTSAGETLKRTLDKGDKLALAKLYPKRK